MLNERFGDLLPAAMERETHHCVRLFDEPDAQAALRRVRGAQARLSRATRGWTPIRSSRSGWPAQGSPPVARAASPRRRPVQPPTSRATRRCSRWRRAPRPSPDDGYDRAVDDGDLVVAHVVRGAIHALAPGDLALYGRALIARDDDELAAQLGRQVERLAAEKGFAPTDALDEVADGHEGRAGARPERSTGHELHEQLRATCPRRPDALVQGLQEPPRRSDAVALRDGEGGRPARLGAALHDGEAWPDAGRERGRPPLPRLLRARPSRATSPTGPGSRGPMPSVCGTRSRATSRRCGSARGRAGS